MCFLLARTEMFCSFVAVLKENAKFLATSLLTDCWLYYKKHFKPSQANQVHTPSPFRNNGEDWNYKSDWCTALDLCAMLPKLSTSYFRRICWDFCCFLFLYYSLHLSQLWSNWFPSVRLTLFGVTEHAIHIVHDYNSFYNYTTRVSDHSSSDCPWRRPSLSETLDTSPVGINSD